MSSEFPAVTICNLNSLDLTSQNATGYYIQSLLSKNNITLDFDPSKYDAYMFVKETFSIIKANVLADRDITDEFRKNMGFTIESMLISCYYNEKKCNSSDFSYFASFDYGNCYTFNKNDTFTRKTSKYGPSSGLELELFTGVAGVNCIHLKYFNL